MLTRTLLPLALLAAVAGNARADAPTVDAVKALVSPGLGKLEGAIALPFAYEGLTYAGEGAGACDDKFGATGTIKKAGDVKAFVACLAGSDATDGLSGGDATWSMFDRAKAGDLLTTLAVEAADHKVSKGYVKKLKKAAKGTIFVVRSSTDDPDAYWDEAYTVFHVHQTTTGLKLDGIASAVDYMAAG